MIRGILYYLGAWTLIFLLIFFSSCSATYHLNKYQSKGGVCGKIDTIKVTKYDTINHKYYYQDSLVIVNDRIIPQTRQEIRYEYKFKRDTIRLKETEVRYLYKTERKKLSNDKKKSSTGVLNRIIAILIILAAIVVSFLISKK